MKRELNIELYIPKEHKVSSLKEKVYKEELDNINKSQPMDKNQINLATTYFIPKNGNLEVGFFIRNTLPKNFFFDKLSLSLQSDNDEKISSGEFDFSHIGSIPSYTGTPTSVEFKLPKEFIYNSDKVYKLKIEKDNSDFNILLSVDTEIENMPTDLSFEEEMELNNFFRNLDVLRADDMSTDLFKAKRTQDKGVEITVIIRNGYNRGIRIDRFPISIVNFNGTPICKGKFENPSGLIHIDAHKAGILTFKIENEQLFNTVFDLKQCKILFQ